MSDRKFVFNTFINRKPVNLRISVMWQNITAFDNGTGKRILYTVSQKGSLYFCSSHWPM